MKQLRAMLFVLMICLSQQACGMLYISAKTADAFGPPRTSTSGWQVITSKAFTSEKNQHFIYVETTKESKKPIDGAWCRVIPLDPGKIPPDQSPKYQPGLHNCRLEKLGWFSDTPDSGKLAGQWIENNQGTWKFNQPGLPDLAVSWQLKHDMAEELNLSTPLFIPPEIQYPIYITIDMLTNPITTTYILITSPE